MGNTWTTVETSKSPSGIANIRVSDSGKYVKVTFEDGSIDKKFSVDDLPSIPKRIKDGKYFVALSNDKSEVMRIGPANTRQPLTVRCVDFVRPEEGADPEPKEYENKAKHYTYTAFTALLEVRDGMFKGAQIPMFLHYKFVENDGMVGFKGNPDKSPRLRDLMEFLDLTGVTEEPMGWPEDDNVLPELLVRIKRLKRDFSIIVKGGYVESMLAADDYEEDDYEEDVEDEVESDEEEEEVPVKKSNKKPKVSDEDDDVDEDFPKVKKSKKVVEEDEEDEL